MGDEHPKVQLAKFITRQKTLAKPPEQIYHYTSMANLHGILKSRCMWASHINYANDPREYTHRRDVINHFLRARVQPMNSDPQIHDDLKFEFQIRMDPNEQPLLPCPESFFISFSEMGDQLGQWRGYGDGGRGVSIGVGAHTMLLAQSPDLIVRIEYEEDKKNEFLAALYDKWKQLLPTSPRPDDFSGLCDALITSLGFQAEVFKHKGFSEEKEWRIIKYRIPPLNDGLRPIGPDGLPIYTHVRDGQIVPHIEVPIVMRRFGDFVVTPIESLTVGPALDYHKTKYALKCLLNEHKIRRFEHDKLEEIPIHKSDIELSA